MAPPDSGDDGNQLTAACLLSYCAMWPQHKSYILAHLQQEGALLECLQGTEFAADRACVLAAVGSEPAALAFASQHLRADPGVVFVALQRDTSVRTTHLLAAPHLLGAVCCICGWSPAPIQDGTAPHGKAQHSTLTQLTSPRACWFIACLVWESRCCRSPTRR